jgi:hypothetical protein
MSNILQKDIPGERRTTRKKARPQIFEVRNAAHVQGRALSLKPFLVYYRSSIVIDGYDNAY